MSTSSSGAAGAQPRERRPCFAPGAPSGRAACVLLALTSRTSISTVRVHMATDRTAAQWHEHLVIPSRAPRYRAGYALARITVEPVTGIEPAPSGSGLQRDGGLTNHRPLTWADTFLAASRMACCFAVVAQVPLDRARVRHGMNPASSRAINSRDGDDVLVPMPSDGGGQQCRRAPATRDAPSRLPAFRRLLPGDTHTGSAKKAGNWLLLTGHTGDTPDGEYSNDVRTSYARHSATWRQRCTRPVPAGPDVVALNSYHVGLRAQADALLEIAAEFLAEPYPAWTAVGVTELIAPRPGRDQLRGPTPGRLLGPTVRHC